MICRWVRLPNGVTAHVRMATPRRRRCSACNQPTAHEKLRECDWKIGANETCDALVCGVAPTCRRRIRTFARSTRAYGKIDSKPRQRRRGLPNARR